MDHESVDLSTEKLQEQVQIACQTLTHRDKTRARIAYFLLMLLATTLVICMFKMSNFEDAKDLLVLLIGPIFGFLGYYASKMGF